MDLKKFCKIKVGNDQNMRFWFDSWMRGRCLKEQFHRVFTSDSNNQTLVCDCNLEDKLVGRVLVCLELELVSVWLNGAR